MSSGWSQYKQGRNDGGSSHNNIFFPLSGAIAAVSTALEQCRCCLDRSRVSRSPSSSEEFEIFEMLTLRTLMK